MTMKQFIYILLALILSTSCSTTQEKETLKATETSLEPQVSNYQLFETKNLWTFLRLDTRNGKITQVHFTLDSNGYRGEQVLSHLRRGEGRTLHLIPDPEHVHLHPTGQNQWSHLPGPMGTKRGRAVCHPHTKIDRPRSLERTYLSIPKSL